MIRTQVQLDPAQSDWLKHTAHREGTSMARLIREAVDYYRQSREVDQNRQKALQAAGKCCSGTRDTAINHDKHLSSIYG